MARVFAALAALLLGLLLTGCSGSQPSPDGTPTSVSASPSPTASASPTTAPSPEPTVTTPPATTEKPTAPLPPGIELPDGVDPGQFFDEEGHFDVGKFLRWMEEHASESPSSGDGLDCTPFLEWCHYHPGFGNCPWSAFYGGYLCEQYHMDFPKGCEYRIEAGAYLCREAESSR